MQASFRDRILAASAYLFGIPALYIVLTDNKRKGFLGQHGSQAFWLWLIMAAVFFGIRFYIDLIWRRRYLAWLSSLELVAVILMGAYALYCGGRCLLGKTFKLI